MRSEAKSAEVLSEGGKKSQAFTLIELLVVIAIIGILAATILVSLNNVREKTRDKQRKADLSMIKNALEMYYSQNHFFPPGESQSPKDPDYGIGCWSSSQYGTDWNPTLVTSLHNYIDIPKDPLNEYTNQYIYQKVNSSSYVLYAVLENTKDSDCTKTNCALYDTGCPSGSFPQVNYQTQG
jgi:prepilin-type N-terminal cleavage/methylation domain-containing protein